MMDLFFIADAVISSGSVARWSGFCRNQSGNKGN